MRRKSSTYRDTTLRAEKIRRLSKERKITVQCDANARRREDGRYNTNRGLQMKAHAKVIGGIAGNKRVVATRAMRAAQVFGTDSLAVFKETEIEPWDKWAVQVNSDMASARTEKPPEESNVFVTSKHRPPSYRTNEMMFAIRRTELVSEANVVLRAKRISEGYRMEIGVMKSISPGQEIVAHYELS